MRAAMAVAEVGDNVYGEGPTNLLGGDMRQAGMPRTRLGFSKNATSSFPAVSVCGWSLPSTSSAPTLTL